MADEERRQTVDQLRRQEIDEIGQAVKLARNARGWSLRRLASDAGVSASLISAIETGKIVPTVGSLFAISDALNEPAQHFFPTGRRLPGIDSAVEADDGDVPAPERPLPATTQPSGSPERSVDGSRRSPAPQASTRESDNVTGSTTVMDPDPRNAQGDSPKGAPPEAVGRTVKATVPVRPLLRRPAQRVQWRKAPPRPRSVSPRRSGAPVPGAVSGTGRAVSTIAGGEASSDPERSDSAKPTFTGTPGVTIVRAAQRPTIRLERGGEWSLPFPRSQPIGQVIEVSIPPATAPPSHHRVREYDTSVLVLSGWLVIEAAFSRTVLESGDTATIGAGVPYRLQGDELVGTRFLVVLSGEWDGRV